MLEHPRRSGVSRSGTLVSCGSTWQPFCDLPLLPILLSLPYFWPALSLQNTLLFPLLFRSVSQGRYARSSGTSVLTDTLFPPPGLGRQYFFRACWLSQPVSSNFELVWWRICTIALFSRQSPSLTHCSRLAGRSNRCLYIAYPILISPLINIVRDYMFPLPLSLSLSWNSAWTHSVLSLFVY